MSASESKDGAGVKVTVFGGGTFATALATVFARNGADVTMLMRNTETAASINTDHINKKYFPEHTLLPNIRATNDPEEGLRGCQYILHAVPVQPSADFLSHRKQFIPPDVPIISLSKGIHHDSLKFMVDIIHESVRPDQPTAFLSGPSFAKELMDDQPTGMVIASDNADLAARVQELISGPRLRVYTTDDVMGVELGGAVKNVYAIGAGIAAGMGWKLNTAALVVTRACSEMKRLSIAMGGRPETLSGLSGVGDLMLTCFGPSSRNRTVGFRLGQGEKLDDIVASMAEVAEGVPTTGAVVRLAEQHQLDLPLAQAVAAMIEGADPLETMNALMALPLRPED